MSEKMYTTTNNEQEQGLSEIPRPITEAERQNAVYIKEAVDAIFSSINFDKAIFTKEDLEKIDPLYSEINRLVFGIYNLVNGLIDNDSKDVFETSVTESLLEAHDLLEQLKNTADKILQKVDELGYEEKTNEESENGQTEIKTTEDTEKAAPEADTAPETDVILKEDETSGSSPLATPTLGTDGVLNKEVEEDLLFFRRWQNGDPSIFVKGEWGKELSKIKRDIRVSLLAVNYNEDEINSFFAEVVNPWSKEVWSADKPKKGAGSWGELKDRILRAMREKLQDREPDPEVFKNNYSIQDFEDDAAPSTPEGNKTKTEESPIATEPKTPEPEKTTAVPKSEKRPDEGEIELELEGVQEDLLNRVKSTITNYRQLEEKLITQGLLASFYYDSADVDRHIADLEKLMSDPDLKDKTKAKKISKKIEQKIRALRAIQQKMSAELPKDSENDSAPDTVADSFEAVPTPIPETNTEETPATTDSPEPAGETDGESSDTPLPNPDIHERQNYTPERQAERKRLGAETRLARFDMNQAEQTYKQALYQFNVNKSFTDKIIGGFQKLRGQEVTTQHLSQLKAEADEKAELYRKSLLTQIEDRSKDRVITTELTVDSDNLHEAFYKKLVTKVDVDEQSEIAKANAERSALFRSEHPKLIERVEKISKFIPKNKKVRLGLRLLAAAGFGASAGSIAAGSIAVGALGGAAFGSARWLASTAAGMSVGAFMNRRGGKRIEKAEADLSELLAGQNEAKKLSIAELRQSVRLAHAQVDSAKLRRTTNTLLATFAAGLGTRGLIGVADLTSNLLQDNTSSVFKAEMIETATIEPTKPNVIVDNLDNSSSFQSGSALVDANLDNFTPGQMNGSLTDQIIIKPELDLYGGEINKLDVTSASNGGVELNDSNHSQSLTNKVEYNNDPINDNLDKAQTPFSIPSFVQVLSDKVNGGTVEATVSGVELEGTQTGFIDIPSDKLNEIQNIVRLTINDNLASQPHLSEDQLEKILFVRLSVEYGDEDWWKNAHINRVDIGDIKVNHESIFTNQRGNTALENNNTQAVDNVPIEKIIDRVTSQYEVKSGENLSTILHKSVLAQVDAQEIKLPPGVDRDDLGKFLYEKFPEMTSANNPHWTLSPQEWKELGVRSGNPHLIHPGEKIDVGKLMAKLVDTEVKVGQSGVNTTSIDVLQHPKTGPLPISQIDPFEQQIKISQDLPWKPLTPTELEAARVQGILDDTIETGPVEPIYHIPISPIPEKLDGTFYDNPIYQKYLIDNGIDSNKMEQVISKTVSDFEGDTLTTGEELLGKFDSPYHRLSHMTMGQLAEIEERVGDSPEKLQAELIKIAGESVNFKPQTLMAWYELLNQIRLQGVVPYNNETTLSDLYKREIVARFIELEKIINNTKPK